MKFKTKLILMFFVPVIISTVIAIYVSSAKLKEQGLETLERKTKAILSRMEAVRGYVATQYDMKKVIQETKEANPDGYISEEVREELLKKVPIFASMAVGRSNSESDNYEFRVASKKARNKNNKANSLEEEFITKFENDKALKDMIYTNEATNELWVMRPVRLSEKQGCLECHGNPSNSIWGNGKDVLGYDMENYLDGEIEGLFIIKSSLSANNNEVQSNIQSAIVEITLIMTAILLIIIIISYSFIKNTNLKISNIIKVNKQIADGDLTEKLEVKGNDEFAEIYKNLNRMTDALTSVVEAVNQTATLLIDESTSTTKLSKELASSSNGQAAAVEEISVSMEEMNSTIDQNTSNAKSTEEIARVSASEIQEGNASSQKALESMFTIKEELDAISDISNQTNILALNASVEAARAGSVGAGFSIVAGEIRKLAERSRSSAERIENLFSEGVDTVQNTGTKIAEIVPDITKTSSLLAEIVSSSVEQSTGASEINNAIQGLNTATQTNAQIADNMSSKAEKLNKYAIQLQKRIAFFKMIDIT